ncbi:MAG: hypothetical protein IJY25_00715 [Bacilli bacterium]|nr:hypothetical protein [Bacilli bacterium]
MLEKMDDINIYNDSAIILNRKTPRSIISWITILIILLIILIILFCIPFNIYKNFSSYLTLEDSNSYIVILASESDFPIYKNKKLYIQRDCYNYDIVGIKDNQVILKVDLKDNIKINNNTFRVNILSNRTTVFEILKNKIKKGFGL